MVSQPYSPGGGAEREDFSADYPDDRAEKIGEDAPSKRASRLISFQPTSSSAELVYEFAGTRTFQSKMFILVEHKYFTAIISTLIGLNAVFIGVETELTYNSDLGHLPALDLGEALFTVAFFLELAARLLAYRLRFFLDAWNIFDFVLVSVAVLDTFILSHIAGGGGSLGVMLTMRILRLFRLARLVRLLRFFRELWMLVVGVFDAMKTLVWAWLLVLLLVYIFAIFTTRMIGKPHADVKEIQDFFGDVPLSMFTLFTIVTMEGWADVVRTSMEYEGWSWMLFMVFIFITSFAVMNVVIAVVVNNTLDQALDEQKSEASRNEKLKTEAIWKIFEVFRAADTDGDGQLTKEEFIAALKNRDVNQNLHDVGIDVRQADNLFSILDHDDSGALDAREFIEGVLRARGPGQARDLLCLNCDLKRAECTLLAGHRDVRRSVKTAMDEMESEADRAQQGVSDLRRLAISKYAMLDGSDG